MASKTAERTYTYKGHSIRKDAFRFRVWSLREGAFTDDSWYVPSFKTLAAAKAYVDRQAA